MGMLLFTLCLDPLLCLLDKNLTATTTGSRNKRATVIAYADDVTIVLRSPEEVPIVQEALRCYEAASGAKLVSRMRAEFHPDPAHKMSANLYYIYHCCVYSEELLMMDRGTVRNM